MVRNKKARTKDQKYAYIKLRISKAQAKAKRVGFFYLLGLVVLTALACLPLVTYKVDDQTVLSFSVMKVIDVVVGFVNTKALALPEYEVIGLAVYAVLLLVLVINLFRALGKLGWLFTKKASNLYGVNRNMYAMDDLGKIFSASFVWVVVANVVMMLMYQINSVEMLAYAFIGVFFVFHFLCGLSGGKVSLFSTEGGSIEEVKRQIGRFTPFVRNLLQIAAVAAIFYFIVDAAWLTEMKEIYFNVGNANISKAPVDPATGKAVFWQEALVYAWACVIPALLVLIILFAVGMLSHAAGTREFDMEGVETPGRKKFLGNAIFAVLMAGGVFAVQKFVQPEAAVTEAFMTSVYIVAGIALAMAIIELILINHPRTKEEKEVRKQDKKQKVEAAKENTYSDDVDMSSYITENYNVPGVYMNPMYLQGVPYGMVGQQVVPQAMPQVPTQPQNVYYGQRRPQGVPYAIIAQQVMPQTAVESQNVPVKQKKRK